MKAKADLVAKSGEVEIDGERLAEKAMDIHERNWKDKFKAKMAMNEQNHRHNMENTEQKVDIAKRVVGEIKEGVKSTIKEIKKTPEELERERQLRQEREAAWQEKFKLKNETKKEFMELKHKQNIEKKEITLKNGGLSQELMDLMEENEKAKEEAARRLEELSKEHDLERKRREAKSRIELLIVASCLLVFGLALIIVSIVNEKLVVFDGVSVIGLFILVVDIIVLMVKR